ncbi:hypothetical protein GOP47_0008983 [Adiantum capillus-veneris]|uniref:Uncharacterized protein n=1 Tax=Adiantum capillus-veneris TaxID=13818 RepID=A0A9D4UZK5_ADICA|nr:hypothetical protein GOP47_0008983 [Adiantum capillus-veneris]
MNVFERCTSFTSYVFKSNVGMSSIIPDLFLNIMCKLKVLFISSPYNILGARCLEWQVHFQRWLSYISWEGVISIRGLYLLRREAAAFEGDKIQNSADVHQ